MFLPPEGTISLTSSVCVCVCVCVCARAYTHVPACTHSRPTLWDPRQAPLSMKFPRQEYWSRLSFPTPGDLPNPGIKSMSLASPTLASGFFYCYATWEAQTSFYYSLG